mmetsp:Transcript_24385/g.37598  ORF Transcript_24385/g.37598 Transcript_24385/m.37598 type:complete len:234 (+) Transcript_24385:537-1238(+)
MQTLQYDGLVQAMGGKNWSAQLLREAKGFRNVDTHQVPCHVLDVSKYNDMKQLCSKQKQNNADLILEGTLMEGLLSDAIYRMYPQRRTPRHSIVDTTVAEWAKDKRKHRTTSWETFHSLVLYTLHNIAFKHETTISMVALRWALQLDRVGSVIKPTILGAQSQASNPTTTTSPRNVFTFELDEEDLEKLANFDPKQEGEKTLDFAQMDFEEMSEDEITAALGLLPSHKRTLFL